MQQVLREVSTLSEIERWMCIVFTSLDNKGKDTEEVATAKPQFPCEGENKDHLLGRVQNRVWINKNGVLQSRYLTNATMRHLKRTGHS